jgi:hypothetical protein
VTLGEGFQARTSGQSKEEKKVYCRVLLQAGINIVVLAVMADPRMLNSLSDVVLAPLLESEMCNAVQQNGSTLEGCLL